MGHRLIQWPELHREPRRAHGVCGALASGSTRLRARRAFSHWVLRTTVQGEYYHRHQLYRWRNKGWEAEQFSEVTQLVNGGPETRTQTCLTESEQAHCSPRSSACAWLWKKSRKRFGGFFLTCSLGACQQLCKVSGPSTFCSRPWPAPSPQEPQPASGLSHMCLCGPFPVSSKSYWTPRSAKHPFSDHPKVAKTSLFRGYCLGCPFGMKHVLIYMVIPDCRAWRAKLCFPFPRVHGGAMRRAGGIKRRGCAGCSPNTKGCAGALISFNSQIIQRIPSIL